MPALRRPRWEFLRAIPGITFERTRRCAETSIDGLPVTFIGREDLIANKKATNGARDLRRRVRQD
jgi:hypothetical protein